MWKGRNRKTKDILKIVRTLLETRLEATVKKEAEKIRKDGRKNRRIRNRKAKNIFKIVRRLQETRLEAKTKKTIVEARPEDWNRKIKKSKMWKDNRKKGEKYMLKRMRRLLEAIFKQN